MTTAVSAPGKVLLTGGYLVLDRAYSGMVFGLSARIHVLVNDAPTDHDSDGDANAKPCKIVVKSPQFTDAEWTYACRPWEEHRGVQVSQVQGATPTFFKNPFVETALAFALTYLSCNAPEVFRLAPVNISILADNDYYSSPSTFSPALSSDSHTFVDFNIPLLSAHKTGLGSSAALVTALTGAILSHFMHGPQSSFSLESEHGRKVLHNLAQAAHCAAQGKVGSGFDVAAAVYGTCTYRRFSPSLLSALGEYGSAGFATRLNETVNAVWDTEIEKSDVIPPGEALIMCDVDCGSQTVGMVKKVLGWKNGDPAGYKTLCDSLHLRNRELAAALASTSRVDIGDRFTRIREKIREMGTLAGVPIEPAEQTELLDAVISNVPGVLGGVVPGAGGYDAVVFLVKDDKETLDAVSTFLADWTIEKKGNVKLLGAKGEKDGARKENELSYATMAS